MPPDSEKKPDKNYLEAAKPIIAGSEPTNQQAKNFRDVLQLEKYAPNTVETYTFYFSELLKNDITDENIKKFVRRFNNNVSRAALKKIRSYLKIHYEIPPIKGRKKTNTLRYLEPEEIKKIVKHLSWKGKIDYATGILVMYETGLRISELLSISLLNIDFNQNRIRGIGKGRVEYEVNISHGTAQLLAHLGELREEGERLFQKQRKVWAKELRKEAQQCLGKPVTPHWIRHSCGTNLAKKGLNLRELQLYLRHKHIGTTIIYEHATNQESVLQKIKKII